MWATEKAVGGAAAKKAAGEMAEAAAEVVEVAVEEAGDGRSGRMGSTRGASDCETNTYGRLKWQVITVREFDKESHVT